MDNDKKSPQSAVETYASDIADALQDDKGGIIKKIIEGEEAKEIEKKKLSPESRQNKTFMLLSAALVLIGLGTIVYFTENKTIGTTAVGEEFTPLIFTDKSAFIEVAGYKKAEIVQSVRSEFDTGELRERAIKGVYLMEKKALIGLRRFIELNKMSFAPSDPALIYENFLMGVVKTRAEAGGEDGSGFFILLKGKTNGDLFGPVHNWEGKMFSDLHELLGYTLDADNNYLLTKEFRDSVVENKNARMLYDRNGKLVLFYIFADNTSVVFSDSLEAAREVLLRLSSKETKE